MKILLCYSKDHFDPSRTAKNTPTWGISANIIARELHAALSKFGEVTYSDGYDFQKHAGEKYDLFVGPDRNFTKILEVCEIKKSILIAVNMHPRERNQILVNFAERQLGNNQAISEGDMVNERDARQAINKADFIFCVGNNTTLNSYLMNGVPRNKIKTFNYGLLDQKSSAPSKADKTPRFLYSASAIGLRKGFDLVDELARSIKNQDFSLDIVGRPTSEYYSKKIERLVKDFKDRVVFHGYVPAKSAKYKTLYKKNDFLLFPSLEEGQAGTAIESLHAGLIPIVTPESGIDFSPLGFLEGRLNSINNKEIIKSALNLEPKQLANLKSKAQEYYKELHANFSSDLEETLNSCLNHGYLYPKISIILAVYNKESIIKDLVQHMDRVAKEYENVEAQIIFDGCKDNTEKIVRSYYKNRKDYPVYFYVTPNIFEVKSNNLGLKKATGKYTVIIQDDNFIYDKYCFFEAAQFLDKDPAAAVLGGLAGVNFYPLGTKLEGPGEISMSDIEVYWRQDANTNPALKNRIFEVDACMRGPLFFRKSFMEKYGYLDEAYAPLHQDDMDFCFRVKKYGFKVYCILMDVANKSLTTAHYNEEKQKFFAQNLKDHLNLFYSRWTPSIEKDFLWFNRVPLWRPQSKPRLWSITKPSFLRVQQ